MSARARLLLLLGVSTAACQQPVTLEGIFQQVVADHFEQRTASTHYTLKTDSGYIELAFSDPRMVEDVKSGWRVRLTGVLSGGRVQVNSLPAEPGSSAAAASRVIPRADLAVLRTDGRAVTTNYIMAEIAALMISPFRLPHALRQDISPPSERRRGSMLYT